MKQAKYPILLCVALLPSTIWAHHVGEHASLTDSLLHWLTAPEHMPSVIFGLTALAALIVLADHKR